MSLYRPFYNGKYGVVDLTSLSAYAVDLPWDSCREHIGRAAMNARLLAEYESDSLVFGTGPLTPCFVAELSLTLWLLVRGVDLAKWEERVSQEAIVP